MATSAETTRILTELSDGDRSAANRLMPLVYDELHALAEGFMHMERPGHTLQATALVHEAYLRLVDQSRVDWKSRAHFFAVAAEMIRRILVDHARKHAAAKRGGGAGKVDASEAVDPAQESPVDLLALDEALQELRRLNQRQGRIVELRFFGSLSVEETAHVLGVSPRTVKGDWHLARAWLRNHMER